MSSASLSLAASWSARADERLQSEVGACSSVRVLAAPGARRVIAALIRDRSAGAMHPSHRARCASDSGSQISGASKRSVCSAASRAIACRRSRRTVSAMVRCVMTGRMRRDAEFGRLLDDEIGGVALHRREQKIEIGRRARGADEALRTRTLMPRLDTSRDARAPFAVAGVEDAQRDRPRRGAAPCRHGALAPRRALSAAPALSCCIDQEAQVAA